MDDRMITVFKLPADGSLKAIAVDIPDKLEVLQQYVDGYIEIVTLDRHPNGYNVVMIVNDSGLVWNLPENPIATALYQGYTEAKTPICGNAIVCTADAEGELQDITPWTGLVLLMMANDMRKRGEADDWELSDAEHKAADWIDKQHFQGRGLYTDTDDPVKEV